MAYCSKCGNELIDSAVFCSKCGTRTQDDLANSSSLPNDKKEEVYPFKKNWASAWVLIGSIASPFRVLQFLFAALGMYLVSREEEKNKPRELSSLDTSDVDNYMLI